MPEHGFLDRAERVVSGTRRVAVRARQVVAKTREEKPLASLGTWFASVLNVRCPNCGTRTLRTIYWHCAKCGYPSPQKIRCPNCGQTTARTRDWACQWCGYPLASPLYLELQGDYALPPTESLEQVKREEATATVAKKPMDNPPLAPTAEALPASVAEPSVPVVENTAPEPASTERPAPAAEAPPAPVAPPPSEEISATVTETVSLPQALVPEEEPAPVPVPLVSEEIIITAAEDLCGDFQTDAVLADRKYAGRMLRLKGTVELVESGEIGALPVVTLASIDSAAQKKVRCFFSERYRPVVTRMAPGQKVAVFGRYDGCEQDIRLTDCMPVG